MEALGISENAPFQDVVLLCQGLMQAFSRFVKSRHTYPLLHKPKHVPQVYLRIWNQMQTLTDQPYQPQADLTAFNGEVTEPAHPGLISEVPRKRRTGVPGGNVRHHQVRL
jgi:hypothetical protein